jgi:hypothetical protein
MHRALRAAGVNSTLEEPAGKSHWWWDTHFANDGGVLGDTVMRDFYRRCRDDLGGVDVEGVEAAAEDAKAQQGQQPGGGRKHGHEGTGEGAAAVAPTATATAAASAVAVPPVHRCLFQNITLTVVNPAATDTTGNTPTSHSLSQSQSHSGSGTSGSLCGFTVLQQHRSLAPSHVRVTCRRGRHAVRRERALLKKDRARRLEASRREGGEGEAKGRDRRAPRGAAAPPPPPRVAPLAPHPVLDSPWHHTHDR